MINDLLDDLTRLDTGDKIAMRGLNNNDSGRSVLRKQNSLMSAGSSRGSGPELMDNQGVDRVRRRDG